MILDIIITISDTGIGIIVKLISGLVEVGSV